ncbi:MAG: hypothetical protein K8T25_23140, partial [Planctomycetia bacterium]|nr:hypothetical protein [Planctomycetia bacterium]
MKRVRYVLYALVAVGLVAVATGIILEGDGARVLARDTHAGGERSVDLLSAPYKLDRIYLSMRGPRSNQPRIELAPAEATEKTAPEKTLWLTGVDIDVVDAQNLSAVSREFFCHANLTLNPVTTTPEKHNRSFAAPTHANWRLFTLV